MPSQDKTSRFPRKVAEENTAKASSIPQINLTVHCLKNLNYRQPRSVYSKTVNRSPPARLTAKHFNAVFLTATFFSVPGFEKESQLPEETLTNLFVFS